MYKVAPILKTVIHQSQQMYNLHCEVAIDEAIIGYKGRYNGIPTVFIQGKPRAKGFKVYVLADSHSNYVANLKFMTSTGSHEEDMRNVSKTAALCENLIQPFTGLHHVLYTDSYYTSIEMASRLLDYHHTYVVGSMRQDRRGFPNALRTNPRRNPASDVIKNLCRWQFAARQKDNLVVVSYKDSKLLNLLSTCREGFKVNDGRINRFIKSPTTHRKSVYSLPAPDIVGDYNKYMGGVDRANQYDLISLPNVRPTNGGNTAICNSYIIYKEVVDEKKTHKAFQVEVGCAMIGGFCSRKQRVTTAEPVLNTYQNHHLVKGEGRGASCRMCIKIGRKTQKGHYVYSVYKCNECGISLCRDCFLPYHHEITCNAGKGQKVTQTEATDQAEARWLWEHRRDAGGQQSRRTPAIGRGGSRGRQRGGQRGRGNRGK
uniref:Uncharacterized protein LOC102802759 n=1 Tax=Saccoglossus kowalevskii TaxID=10224 RepID=A0ABM0LZ69_SACKO|nr:PREDICTED: uncharacterized protein LOC102802759 [Saccoglossus kowalevskii]